MLADGSNGSVELFDDHIVIRRKGIANFLTQGLQGDKSIPLASITAVQFRSAGSMMAGLIQFTIFGGREFRGGMLEATKDENAVLFERKQEAAFVALRDAVQGAISRQSARGRAQEPSSTDELAKLADLVERGYLTRDEYDARKRALLQQPSSLPKPRQPAAAARTSLIRSRVSELSSEAPLVDEPRAAKSRHPFAIGCALVVVVLVSLSYLGGRVGDNAGAGASGGHWKLVGGLDNGDHFKFVEVDQANAGRAVYDDAISNLCGAGGCAQVGFFLAGDTIPPSTSRSTFFQDGGWANYSPAAVYSSDSFTKWDCEKAGMEGAPLSALCGEEARERYGAVLALATRAGWTESCGLPVTDDKQLVERYAAKISDLAQRTQIMDAFKSMYNSSISGPDDPADCQTLRSKIENKAKAARKTLAAASA